MAEPHESTHGAPDGRRTAMQTKALGILVAIVAVAGVVALILTVSGSGGSSQAARQPSGSQVGDQSTASPSVGSTTAAPTTAPSATQPATKPASTKPATTKPAATIEPAATRSTGSATAATKVVKYTVKKGDNLTVISGWFGQRGYGLVYDWNKSVIGRNPDLIHPGQTIIVSLTGTTMNVTTRTK